MMTWCVWASNPHVEGGRKSLNWSQVASGLTREEAEELVDRLPNLARAMPDGGIDYQYPVISIARKLCHERHPAHISTTGQPCEECWDASRR